MATQIGGFSVGDKVYFGRTHGEQTYGEVVELGRTKLKIKQLEERGMHRTRPAGTIWTVPPSLCRKAVGAPVTVPAPKPAVAAATPGKASPPADFAQKALGLGLPADCFGQWLNLGNQRVQIVGIETRRPAYPVSVEGPQGGRYKVSVAMVQAAMSLRKAPAASRPDDEIMKDIVGCYSQLSPENLSCDGELSMSAQRRRAAEINSRLRGLETELGRKVGENDAWQWEMYQTRRAAR